MIIRVFIMEILGHLHKGKELVSLGFHRLLMDAYWKYICWGLMEEAGSTGLGKFYDPKESWWTQRKAD